MDLRCQTHHRSTRLSARAALAQVRSPASALALTQHLIQQAHRMNKRCAFVHISRRTENSAGMGFHGERVECTDIHHRACRPETQNDCVGYRAVSVPREALPTERRSLSSLRLAQRSSRGHLHRQATRGHALISRLSRDASRPVDRFAALIEVSQKASSAIRSKADSGNFTPSSAKPCSAIFLVSSDFQ